MRSSEMRKTSRLNVSTGKKGRRLKGMKEGVRLAELQRESREKRPRVELFRCHSVMCSARIRHLRRIGAHVGVAHAGEAIHKSSVKPL